MARIIDLGVTKEMLTMDNFPSIKILDKCYVVDDRQKTFEKIQDVQNDEKLTPKEKEEKIYTLALGADKYKEIKELDLSASMYNYFTYCVMSVYTGDDPKELQKQAKEASKQQLKN